MNKFLRILFISPTYWPFINGAQTFLQAMAERLVTDGHVVTVLTTTASCAEDFWRRPVTSSYLPPQEVLNGVQVERLALTYPWPAPFMFGVLRRLGLWLHRLGVPAIVAAPAQRYLAKWMPPLVGLKASLEQLTPSCDLVHVEDSSWDGLLLAGATAAAHATKPLVVQPLMHLGGGTIAAHYQMAHQVQIYRRAHAVIALSEKERAAFQSLGVLPEKLHVLRMGVDPWPFDNEIGQREYPEPDSAVPAVLFLGANTYDKGAFTLAQAIIRLNQAGVPVNLTVAGPRKEDLISFLQQRPPHEQAIIGDHIRILGFVDDNVKHHLLESAFLLALPSRVDTFGIVFLEAWQHARPVIGALAGGIPEVITHGRNGLLVPFGDAAALAKAIQRLLEDRHFAQQLGNAGYVEVQNYTWERTYTALLKIYDDLRGICG